MFVWMLGAFVFILGPLLFLHELGHYWAAKRLGVPVEEFGFGLGPKLITLFTRNGTEYTIRAIPFAAFVRMAGEEEIGPEEGLMTAPRGTRFGVAAAGPVMNIVASLFLIWGAYLFGPPAYTRVAVTHVVPGAPADTAGLRIGDLVLQADDVVIEDFEDLAGYTQSHLGESVTLLIERDGEEKTVQLIPRREGEYDPDTEGPMGIGMGMVETGPPVPQGVLEAGSSAIKDFAGVIEGYVNFPRMLVRALEAREESIETGIPVSPEEDLRNFRPIGIFGILQLISYPLEIGITGGYWIYIFRMAGFFSLVLGLSNLLPLPALDGGRILFVIIDWISETIFRRKINPEKEIIIHAVGLIVLLLLMFVITWQDIFNPIPLLQTPTPTPLP
jgi:regulator of sigma E protease